MNQENINKKFNWISNFIVIDFYGVLLCTVGINLFTSLLFSNNPDNSNNNFLKMLGLALIISGIVISVIRISFSIIQKSILDEAKLPGMAYTDVQNKTLNEKSFAINLGVILFWVGSIIGSVSIIILMYLIYMDY